MRRRYPQLFTYGPFVLIGVAMLLIPPIAWAIDPRTQHRDGSHPQPLRDNTSWLIILGLCALGGFLLVVSFARAWIRSSKTRRPLDT